MPYVFGYGSLVDRESLEASIGRRVPSEDGPHPVRLTGFRRAWNVVTPTSVRPDYRFTGANGEQWQGLLGWLGLEARPGEQVLGAVYRLETDDLTVLDRRELSYDRVDLSAAIAPAPPIAGEAVFTYVPSAAVTQLARTTGADCRVMARYVRLVDRAFRSLGADLYAEHLRTLPDMAPFSVEEILTAPVDAAMPNAAVDPRTASPSAGPTGSVPSTGA